MITFSDLIESLHKPIGLSKFRQAVADIKVVDARQQSWMKSLSSIMKEYNWYPVGKGKYGFVFTKDGYPYIIKVFMKDTAYLKWLNFAKQNQDNPYVPKIRGKVVKINDYFMAVRLEKLSAGGDADTIYKDEEDGNKYAKQVVDFLESNSRLMDLHNENVMQRGNQLVIIDPFYNWVRDGRFTIDVNDVSQFKDIL